MLLVIGSTIMLPTYFYILSKLTILRQILEGFTTDPIQCRSSGSTRAIWLTVEEILKLYTMKLSQTRLHLASVPVEFVVFPVVREEEKLNHEGEGSNRRCSKKRGEGERKD